MKIHEYQAKAIFRDYGVPVPAGTVASSVTEACEAAAGGSFPVVVKAQVHVGGRGKAGGVKLAPDPAAVKKHATAILGMNIKGSTVRRVLIEPGIDIQTEYYVGMIVDRARRYPCLMVSAAGGVEIEEVAATTPEKIARLHIDPALGLRSFQIRRAARFLAIPKQAEKALAAILGGFYRAFMEKDCSLAEINPLVLTGAGELIACDAKINFDDNAAYRHPEYAALRDDAEAEPLEVQARHAGLSYVKLDGRIGCIVNGAGLAMATMDIVKHFGGEPANFLDIGGGAKAEQVTEALRIVTADPAVNTVLFNIFGGIVRCDRVAEGILEAMRRLDLVIPIVLRLVGTNEDKARALLAGTSLIACATMSEAARTAVELSTRGAT
ncbi:MAG: ADP-forming succinate--CoA ligase subunit beta [Phycisphaerae bacterium]|nr:ADP-forming succinate--CoA ligase subunit beta [Phycisphaerae bacterium]